MNSGNVAGCAHGRRLRAPGIIACGLALWCALVAVGSAQDPAAGPARTRGCAEMETFLRTARIVTQRELPVGITVPSRATLDDGARRHDAAIQFTDERKPVFETARGTELNFRDSWQFNVAGYELAKILQLNMVPPYVERKVEGRSASVSWWVEDAMMERERYRRKIEPPDAESWNHERYAVRVFHQLIHDTDPNMTNLLITKDWRTWMIDFTRAFRWTKALQKPHVLVKCDRRLLARLRELTREMLEQKLGRWLANAEIAGLLGRRDMIVRHFEDQVRKRGERAVLYDLPRTSEPCGTGLQ